MTKDDASRVQSSQVSLAHLLWKFEPSLTNRFSQAKAGNDMSSNGFAARAQSAGDRNANINASTNSSSSNTVNRGGNAGVGNGGGRAGSK